MDTQHLAQDLPGNPLPRTRKWYQFRIASLVIAVPFCSLILLQNVGFHESGHAWSECGWPFAFLLKTETTSVEAPVWANHYVVRLGEFVSICPDNLGKNIFIWLLLIAIVIFTVEYVRR